MIQRIYKDEPCPLDGYGELTVRVLANATENEWRAWTGGSLELPGCEACAKLRQPKVVRGRRKAANAPTPEPDPRAYCPSCKTARAKYGQTIVTFFGPTLLGEHDVSTFEAALALFDDDDALPSELVLWLQFVPGAVRSRRQETLLGNLISSAMNPAT